MFRKLNLRSWSPVGREEAVVGDGRILQHRLPNVLHCSFHFDITCRLIVVGRSYRHMTHAYPLAALESPLSHSPLQSIIFPHWLTFVPSTCQASKYNTCHGHEIHGLIDRSITIAIW
jgi:hypothetical protein